MAKKRAEPASANDSEFQFSEAVSMLWEGMQKALAETGLDRSDLAALCDIIVRLADHRLLLIEAKYSPPQSEQAADQVRHYRKLASDLHRRASTPPPDPDWSEVSERLRSVGSPALELLARPKE
jgi:hypothetical protein